MVTAVVMMALVVRKSLFVCMLGCGICGVGSGDGVNSGCGGSFLANNHHHHHHHHHKAYTKL